MHTPGHMEAQSTDDFLNEMFGPLGIGAGQYSQYSQFFTEIPEELYALTDPNAEIYQQYRTEQQGRLSDQLGETYTGLEQSLFQGQREARGMQGRAGLVRGRNFMEELSQQTAMQGQRAGSAFGRGLYDIEEEIAELAGLFDDEGFTAPNELQPGMMGSGYNFSSNFNFNFTEEQLAAIQAAIEASMSGGTE